MKAKSIKNAKPIKNAKSITPELIEKWTCKWIGLEANTVSDIYHCVRKNGQRTKNGQHAIESTESTESTGSRGDLNILPTETLVNVVLHLDVISVAALRRVNRSFMSVVDRIPEYRMVNQFCPRIIRDIVSLGAKHFDFATLHKTLCEKHCVSCGNIGGYIYLITCLRVCYVCFANEHRFCPMLAKYAREVTGCSKKELEQLPHIRSVQGRYAANGVMCQNRVTLWDRETVRSIQTTTAPTSERNERIHNNPHRFMAIVSAPYVESVPNSNPPSKVAKWGLYCLGCSDSQEADTHFRKQYTEQSFVDHIILHGPVIADARRPRHAPPKRAALDMSS
ncbi:hypothetical protein F4813DRAFT_341314 [Daldinia decipiens]|uniref:uncharacterized protein n=1 Tax=Daldinia decipiens TaxID=326647 RepID=UPI0020C337A6|nr:uncharacterized protein F4813DRAFT_341314 [Daldinia decipiens]KAI1662633.1 hypothetical protein F4813DRAFT_341314 [Daldinia decipiens]